MHTDTRSPELRTGLRVRRVAIISGITLIALVIGLAAVARVATPAAVPCGATYILQSGTNWTSATWSGGPSAYPGATTTNDCASITNGASVAITTPLPNPIAGLTVNNPLSAAPASVVDVQTGGSITLTGTSTLSSTLNKGQLLVSGGTVTVASGAVVNVNSGGDVAVSGGTLTVAAGGAVNVNASGHMAVNSGTLDNSAAVTVASSSSGATGTFDFTGGTIQNTGTLATTVASPYKSVINITGASGAMTLDKQTITNDGTISFISPSTRPLTMSNGAAINITGTGRMDFNNSGSSTNAILNGAGSNSMTIASGGLVTCGNGGGASIQVPFNNNGTVRISGVASNSSFTMSGGGTHTGTFQTSSSADSVQFGGGTHTWSTNTNLFDSANFFGTAKISAGIVNASTNVTIAGGLSVTGGQLNVPTGITVNTAGLGQTGGTISGPGNIAAGGLSWSNGIQNGGGTTKVSGSATMIGGTSKSLDTSRILEFATGSGPDAVAISTPYLGSDGSGIVLIDSGVTLTLAGSGTTSMAAQLASNGSVNITSGSLQLNSGGSLSGTIGLAAGTSLILPTGTVTFGSGATSFTGTGTLVVNGATLDLKTNIAPPNATVSSGLVKGLGNFAPPNLTWSGGTLGAPGDTGQVQTSAVTFNPASSATLNTRILANGGTFTWSSAGTLYLDNGAIFSNTSTVDAQNNGSITCSASCTNSRFDNLGLFKKTVGTGTTIVSSAVAFNNTGSVDAQTGTIQLAGGTSTGTFNTTTGTMVDFNAGTHTFSSPAAFTGTGKASFSGATAVLNSNLNLTNAVVSNGIIKGAGNFVPTNLMWSGGTIGATGDTGNVTIPVSGTVQITGTESLNTRPFNNSGTVTWTGNGTLSLDNSAVITNLAGAMFDMQGDGTVTGSGTPAISNSGAFQKSVSTGTTIIGSAVSLTNALNLSALSGTLELDGGGSFSGNLTAASGAIINLAAGTYAVSGGTWSGAGEVKVSGAAVNVNANVSANNLTLAGGTTTIAGPATLSVGGTLLLSGGATGGGGALSLISPATATVSASTTMGANLKSNAGTALNVNSPATLTINNGATSSGTCTIASGGTVDIASGTFSVSSGSTFTSNGTLKVSGGSLSSGIPLSTANFVMTSGTQGCCNVLTINTAGTWSGGTIVSGITVAPGATLNWTGGTEAGGAVVTNNGNLNITAAVAPVSVSSTLNNNGTLVCAPTANAVSFGSAITNGTAGFFDLQTDASLGSGTITFTNAGTLKKSAGTGTTTTNFNVSNTGNVYASSGTLRLAGLTQSGGLTQAGPGALSFPGTFAMSGGILDGSGSVIGSVSNTGGAVNPGTSPGTLTISGNYTQSAPAVMNLEVAGTTAGTLYDVLNITGTATLGGTLNVSLLSGFTPAYGDTFNVMSFASLAGGFNTINLPTATLKPFFLPATAPTSLALTVVGTADLAVTQSAPATMPNGQSATVSVTLTNNGPQSATSVPLTDTFTGPATISSATMPGGTCTISGLTVSCTATSIPSGSSVVATITVNATATGTITSSPSVPTANPPLNQYDNVSTNNAATVASITVNPASDLSLAITGPASVVAGSNASFTATVSNTGPDTSTSSTGTFTVTGGTIVSTSGGMTCTNTATSATCSGSTLAAGGSTTTTIIATAASGSSLAISGTVTDPNDPNSSNNTAAATTAIAASADVSATQSGPASVFLGQNATITVTVSNAGPSPATSVSLSDTFTNAALVSATPSQGTCTGVTTISCSLGTLASGGSATVTLTLTATGGSPMTNSASASAAESDPATSNNTATPLSISVAPSADVSVTQSGPASVLRGQNGTITVTVANAGPSAATSVGLSDTFTNGTLVSATPSQGTCVGVTTISCSLGTLASGGSATVTLTLTASGASPMTNSASASAAESDPATSNNTATPLSISVTPSADVSAAQSGPSSVLMGQNATITITVANAGPSSATSVALSDTFTNATFVSATPSQGTCTGVTTISCSLGTLSSGGSATVTLTLTPTGTSPMTNSAGASAAESDPATSNNTATPLSISVTPSADVAITQSGPSSISGSGTITLTVKNNGPSTATAVSVSDTITGGTVTSATSTSGSCSGTAPVVCSLGTLASGATAQITLSVNAGTTSTSITNNASVSAAESDPAPSNNTAAPLTITVFTTADLAIAITHSPEPALLDGAVTYTATISNSGPSTAPSYTVAFSLSGGTIGGVSGGAGLVCSSTSTTASCSGTSLAAGGSTTVTIQTAVSSAKQSLSGTVTASNDTNTSNNSASDAPTVVTTADVYVTKTGPATAASGDTIEYTITVGNNGPLTASNVVLTDPTPTGLTLVSVSGACTSLPCTIATFAPSSSLTVKAKYTVTASAPATITNTASVSTNTSDTVTTNNTATATTQNSGCTAAPPQLLSPVAGARVSSPVAFSWSAVTGASQYDVFQVTGTGNVNLGTVLAPSTNLSANVATGPLTWYVVATIPNCGTVQSGNATANTCNAPPPPSPSVVANAASDQSYSVQWAAVADAASYEIQEARDEAFTSGVTTQTLTTTSFSYSHTETAAAGAYFYRVRGVSLCNPQLKGAYSVVLRTVVAPVIPGAAPNVNVPVGSTKVVVEKVTIPGLPDGNYLFTATVDKPWMTVEPASGTLTPAGITLTILADPTTLPNGTFTGTIILVLTPVSTTGNTARVNGGTTISVPVSVNLVTPVSPTTKTSTASNVLIIPSVGHLEGMNSQWQSDIRLANVGFSKQQYALTFTPSASASGAMANTVKQTTVTVDAGATTALDDVARNWFGIGSLGEAANGVLEVRPLNAGASSIVHDSATTPGVSITTVASSRTYNVSTAGTLGQYIPAIPFSNFIGKAEAGALGTVLSLQQIAQSTAYRTNIGIVEGSGAAAAVTLSVYDDSGKKLTDYALSLNPYQQVQLNSFLSSQGIALNDGRVEVKVTGGNGKVTAYASVVDNRTNDPLLVSGVPIGKTLTSRYVLPGVAALNNGGANWQTDMRIFNSGAAPQTATLTLYPLNGGTPLTATATINPNEVKLLDGVVQSLFNQSNIGGALHVTTASDSSLVVTGRTYNQTSTGTYGQFVPAVTTADAIGANERSLNIIQVEDSPRYRTNLGIAEVTGKPATVQIMVFLPDSKVTPKIEIPLAAFEYKQFPVIQSLGLGNIYNARISVQVIGGTGRVTAYGSVIDQVTQDPTYIPAQ